ncbi:MAG: sigma-70 family RNA polymerase sigma factor [bacterium]|nr:sigma-70 family RNA polymerase sigma factor [bacterium]
MTKPQTNGQTFAEFHNRAEPQLRRALIARYGGDIGREAAAEALAYGWENWDRVRAMGNPLGYLYRVGQSRSRRLWPRRHVFEEKLETRLPWVEPGLPRALNELPPRQRQVVVLVHGFEYTHQEVADLLGISRSSVQNHVERGLARLRNELEVPNV